MMEPFDMQADGLQDEHEGAEVLAVQAVTLPNTPVYPVSEATEHACGALEAHLLRGGLGVRLDRAHLAARLAPVVSLHGALMKLQGDGARLEGSVDGPASLKEQEHLRLHEVLAAAPQDESHLVLDGYTLVGPNGDRYAVK